MTATEIGQRMRSRQQHHVYYLRRAQVAHHAVRVGRKAIHRLYWRMAMVVVVPGLDRQAVWSIKEDDRFWRTVLKRLGRK